MNDKTINKTLMFLGGFLLFLGLLSGIQKIGWRLPINQPILFHGSLMIGFLGVLISLERAISLKKSWGYLSPFFIGLGFIGSILNQISILSIILGGLILVYIFYLFTKKQPSLHLLVMLTGSIVWVLGNVLWFLEYKVHIFVLFWIGFLILTISGERLELNRIYMGKNKKNTFIFTILLVNLGLLVSIINFNIGIKIFSIGIFCLSIWLLFNDISRYTIKEKKKKRFIGLSLFLGYCWLSISGLTGLFFINNNLSFIFDVFLHSVFLGFVFSMIFGHVYTILPPVLGLEISYSKFSYIHLLLLHFSLIVRFLGDFWWLPMRKFGGLLNVLAIILFFVSIIKFSEISIKSIFIDKYKKCFQ